nr:uncharacterized protein LOC111999678 [Quercus suber]
MVQKVGGKSVEMFSDSRLVVGQVKGEMEARDPRMQEYLGQVKRLQSNFDPFSLSHIPKGGNSYADSLATLATSTADSLPRTILVEHLERVSEATKEEIPILRVGVGPSWMDPIMRFLKDDSLPQDKLEAEKVRRKAPRFWLSEDHKLYRRSYSGPYLLCVHPEAVELLLEELHEGICGNHTGGRSLSHRAVTQGYWWPGMQQEAQDYVKKCDQCQRFAPNIHQPGRVLNPLSSLRPFAQWGLDIVGPFPKAPGNKKYLLVATDYFTKYSTPAYPQGNRQAEAVNKVIISGLKKRLDDAKGGWVEELPHVLWTYRTTPQRSTGKTPFALTYGAEAVIPLETSFPTLRTSSFTPGSNDELLGRSLDLVDEQSERAMIQLAYYQQKLKQGYDTNVRLRPLTPGDLVLRKIVGAAKNPSWGKLGPNWERLYRITSVAGIGGGCGAVLVLDLDLVVVLDLMGFCGGMVVLIVFVVVSVVVSVSVGGGGWDDMGLDGGW